MLRTHYWPLLDSFQCSQSQPLVLSHISQNSHSQRTPQFSNVDFAKSTRSNFFIKKLCPHTFEVAKNDACTQKADTDPKTNLAGVSLQ